MTIERVSVDDLMSLAADRGSAPMQVGVVLLLEPGAGFDPATLVDALETRLPGIPRLRQRLVDVPVMLGRPIWVDDANFSISAQVSVIPCPAPGGMTEVLHVAADLMAVRLPRSRPLWAATVVTGVSESRCALILVFHHVLADGIGGLAVLSELAATEPHPADSEYPRPAPTRTELAADAASTRREWARSLPTRVGRLGEALGQFGPSLHGSAARTSLNQPIGTARRVEIVSYPLAEVRDAAHAQGGTVNDLALAVIAGALRRLLEGRGERLDEIVISVPFSSRAHTTAGTLGNKSGAVPLRLPTTGDPRDRLREIAHVTRPAKARPRGSSIAVLGPLFRGLARVGLFQRFVDHQRTIQTIVTDIRGPDSPLSIGGAPIVEMVPLVAIVGNVTVAFAVSSYVDRLSITVVADPDACPDVADLRQFMDEQYQQLAAPISAGL